MFLAILRLFWPKIRFFFNSVDPESGKIHPSQLAEEGEVGLLAEISLRLDLENCILSLVIDECLSKN
jgi:hypothetical protein